MNSFPCTSCITTFVLLITLVSVSFGQVSPYIFEVKTSSATEQSPLSISVELTQNAQIQRMLLYYREFGVTEYKQLDLLFSGRTATAIIPAKSVTPPYVEYYVDLLLSDGTQATFPPENPQVNPLKVDVKGVDPKDMEVRFLSPESGETLAAEDLAVAISLMYASDDVDKQKTRLYFDGADVTKEAILSDDVILYNPKNFNKVLSLGSHSLRIELYNKKGSVYYSKQTNFNLSTATEIEEEKSLLQYTGNAQLEYRKENVNAVNTTYTRGDVKLNGSYKSFLFGYDMHLTNENTDERQPQNRFLGTLQDADYFKLQVGDAYPVFPSLFISGKRVRGVTGSLTLGVFNLDVSYR